MRILYLTCHLPFPPVSGGRRREYEILKRLGREVEFHLIVVSKTFDEDLRNAGELTAHCSSVQVFHARNVRASSGADAPAQVRRHASPEARRHLERILPGGFDLVHVEGFYLFPLLPENPGVPTIVVEQNIEYLLWDQRARLAGHATAREQYRREAAATREWETAVWNRASLRIALTPEDRAEIGVATQGLDVSLVPDGVDRIIPPEGDACPAAQADGPALVFVGNYAYEPNLDGARFLCRDIFPRILEAEPEARLYLVGNAPPEELLREQESGRVIVTGPVSCVYSYLRAADVFVCPLRIGGGVKVKMLEALALGKAIVTTPIGAQGITDLQDAFVIAEDPAEFAREVVNLLRNRERRESLERLARAGGARLPSWEEAAASLRVCYTEVRTAQNRLIA